MINHPEREVTWTFSAPVHEVRLNLSIHISDLPVFAIKIAPIVPAKAKSTPLFGEAVWIRLMGRSLDDREVENEEVEEAQEAVVSVEDVLEEEASEEETIEAKEPWMVRGKHGCRQ